MQTKKNKQITALKNYTKEEGQKIVDEAKKQEEELQDYKTKQDQQLGMLNDDLNQREQDLLNMKQEKQEKAELLKAISELTVQYELDKKTGRIEANEKEREKIQAVKTLKKEMNFKVKETQANLMALNDEQLQTTTRLTILQNHQLTTELDYQSRQTENLVSKSDEMTKKIEVLKRNISLHKNIEKKLAKRAYKS